MREPSVVNSRVLDLLIEWEERQTIGRPVPPEELCRDYPELLEDVRDGVNQLTRIAQIMAGQADPTDAIAPTVPGFTLLEEIGRGGMGTVYRARDLTLDRVVAIKFPHASGGAILPRKRFEREMRTLALLSHSHIVSIHSAGWAGSRPYFVMDHVAGGNLAQQRPHLSGNCERIAGILEKVARAVCHAHQRGVIHRDLKPSNILIGANGDPLVSDFGVAALLAGESVTSEAGETPTRGKVEDTRVTRTSKVVGTLAYSAPEAFLGSTGKPSPATDVWALGVILYELLTGALPFPDSDENTLRTRIANANPPSPRTLKSGIPRALETIALKCLSKEAGGRYQTAGAVADALTHWTRWHVTRQRRRWLALAAGALVAAAGGIYLTRPEDLEVRHATKMREAKEQLLRGETVILIPEAGEPLSFHTRLGATRTGLNSEGVFFVAAGSPALVELLTDPGTDRYRISAEIRQDGFLGDAMVGVYFGHSVTRTKTGDVHVFALLRFSDLGSQAEQIKEADQPSKSLVGLDWLCLVSPVTTGKDWRRRNGTSREYVPPGPYHPPGPWRQIAIEVQPEQFRATFDNLPLRDFQQKPIVSWTKQELPKLVPQLVGHEVNATPRGGIGVIVHGAEVSVRNVRIERLESK